MVSFQRVIVIVMCCLFPAGFVGQSPVGKLKGPYLGQKPPGTTPEIFAPGIISYGFHENGIIFSPDGTELFYSSSDSKYTSKTLIHMKSADNEWSIPEVALFSGSYYDHSAFFSRDGKKIFFSSQRPPGTDSREKKDLDVWVVEKEGGRLRQFQTE